MSDNAPSGSEGPQAVSTSNRRKADHEPDRVEATTDDEVDVNAPYGLSIPEENWAEMQQPLEERGYMLRPRYRPGWVGSWVGTKKKPEKCEDSIGIGKHGVVMDAVRISDGKQVLLKLWSSDRRDAAEFPVLQYFSDPYRANHPHNHCVPLLDVIDIPGWSDYFDHILVEPMLRDWHQPPLLIMAEAISFIRQALEGAAYMHANNVAHGDIHGGNIMMDPSKLFPNGFHGAFNLNVERRLSERRVKRLTRMQVPVKYFYIDFGSSSMFPSFEERQRVPFNAAVWVPPEVKADPDALFDPFKADVYSLGVTLLAEMRFRPQLHFLMPIFAPMIKSNPDERPTVQEMLEEFTHAASRISRWQMRKKLGFVKEARVPLGDRIRYWLEYVRLLVDSYRFGLPEDVFSANEMS